MQPWLTLQRTLRKNDYHIFHFVGHGGFDEKADDGVLVLEDGTNKSRLVAGRDVGTILHDHRSLRLAVLNACEGARAGGVDPFSGAAQSLVRKGVPAVVAMQFEITDDAAIVFAQEFYGAITDALPVDAAVGEARRAMFGQGNDIEWGTPVAYLRGDRRLFDVLAPPPAPAAEEPEPVAPVVAAAAAADVVEEETAEEPEPVVPIPLVPFWRRRPVLFSSAAAFILIVGVVVGFFAIGDSPSKTIATAIMRAPTEEVTTTTLAPTTTRAPTTTKAPTTTVAPFALPDVDQIYNQPVQDAVRLLTAVGLIVHEATIGCSNSTEPGDVRRVTVGTNRNNRIIFGKVTDLFDPAALADVGPGDEVTVWTPTSKPC